ncbi:MAG: XrtA-associated ATPase [Alphaproteobacteria bacterium]|nr:XrtA-associated ATPase [Alphaproteobacteria bacterium]
MYEEFYHLTALPFQLTPDHRFFFGSEVHKRAMAHLEFGLSQGEGFIVITGEVGSGKTTLIRHLLAQIDDASNYVAANMTSTKLEGDDIVRMAAISFGVNAGDRDKAGILHDLEAHLVEVHKRGARAVLIVDEAQNLSISALEELRMFANFQHGSAAVLQIIMVGQPEFRTTIGMPQFDQLRQRILASYHIGPISELETRDYVMHRLQAVGWKDDPMIADAAFKEIYTYSDGVPRRINTLCARILLFGFIEERHIIDAEDVHRVAMDLEAERQAVVATPGHINGAPPNNAADTTSNSASVTTHAMEDFNRLIQRIEVRLDDLEHHLERNDKLLKMMSVAIANTGRRD